MEKLLIRSSSNLESAREAGIEPYWYTVVHDENKSFELAEKNPQNRDIAEYEKTVFLADDCVITIRPARYSLTSGETANYEKDNYFLEISNQDGSNTLSSYRVYSWEEVNKIAFNFRSISFTAATRVWKSKRL